ncbi:MAG: methyltransferase domain-containing protein [Chloroflexota bacterium]
MSVDKGSDPGDGRHARRRYDLLPILRIQPTIGSRTRLALARAISAAEARSQGSVVVLDAGCGRKSPLVRFRARIGRLVGVDQHPPEQPLPWLDGFLVVDLCRRVTPIRDETFDLILSNFTLEHIVDPSAAMSNFYRWLKPGGTLVITTVNRRHPFVAAYLSLPEVVQRRFQPVVKASAADAHPLVGACNDPSSIRGALEVAGFSEVRLETVPNLARAWGRHLPWFLVGLAGDLIAQSAKSRRSTILAVGHRVD